jgi:hypothetical protein
VHEAYGEALGITAPAEDMAEDAATLRDALEALMEALGCSSFRRRPW